MWTLLNDWTIARANAISLGNIELDIFSVTRSEQATLILPWVLIRAIGLGGRLYNLFFSSYIEDDDYKVTRPCHAPFLLSPALHSFSFVHTFVRILWYLNISYFFWFRSTVLKLQTTRLTSSVWNKRTARKNPILLSIFLFGRFFSFWRVSCDFEFIIDRYRTVDECYMTSKSQCFRPFSQSRPLRASPISGYCSRCRTVNNSPHRKRSLSVSFAHERDSPKPPSDPPSCTGKSSLKVGNSPPLLLGPHSHDYLNLYICFISRITMSGLLLA